MNAATAARLIELNRRFYQTFGKEFSATRQRLQPGVRRILESLQGDEVLLDLGCGNGELARQLSRRGHRGAYTGLDFSPVLLRQARRGMFPFPAVFLQSDLSTWGERQPAFRPASFTLVIAFAVLHHLPGADLRLRSLQKIHTLLAPGGMFIHSEWQFLNSARLRARIQPWSEAGLADEDIDPGDALLDWRAGGRGLRYVHYFEESELADLAVRSGFRVESTFFSDGENSRLGIYQVWAG